ncbi:hypothetical protein BGX21_002999 [Mortierella sp. AD011]|nr:hypothetical protein BGX21_002999 [Mortierella sp. AD011]
MVFGTSFLSFHDLTPQLGVLWASPSILDVLGYKPEELVGVNTTDLIVPEDLPDTSEGINENIKNDLAATQIVNALRHKDGRPIRLVHVFTTCYDFVVSCSSMVDAPGHHCKLIS